MVFCFFALTNCVKADNLNDAFRINQDSSLENVAGGAGFNTGSDVDIYKNISTIINFSLSFLGVIFVVLMIYGGWLWMTDQGNEAQVEKAKKIIITAVVGVIIITSSYAISWFIINALIKNTISGG